MTGQDPLDVFRVEQARQFLADINAMDCSDERQAYTLLGRAEVIIAGLVRAIERGDGS